MISRFFYLIREGLRSITTHGFMSFASVSIIMACLVVMGIVSMLSVNIDALIEDLENQNEIVVFVDEAISDENEAKAIEGSIAALDNIDSVVFVSREEAMDNFMSKYDESLMEGIDETVFRHRFVVNLTDIALMSQTQSELEALMGVAKVNAHLEYAKTFVTIRNVVSVISMVLIAMLVFVSIFIMTNTIKLATFGRREEIAIMKMVGATNGFIRMPFVIEGLVLGLLGGGLAFCAVYGLYNLVTGKLVGTLTGNFISVVPFSTVGLHMFVIFMAVSVMVGVFGGVNAIRNYLKV